MTFVKKNKPWNKGKKVRLSPKSEFKRGLIPWNKNTKGIMKSNSGSFQKGRKGTMGNQREKLPVFTITTRMGHTKRHSRPRRWIKIAEGTPGIWIKYSHYIWMKNGGEIIDGYVIHHKDGNTLNDDIMNLEHLTKSEHAKIHAENFSRWN